MESKVYEKIHPGMVEVWSSTSDRGRGDGSTRTLNEHRFCQIVIPRSTEDSGATDLVNENFESTFIRSTGLGVRYSSGPRVRSGAPLWY